MIEQQKTINLTISNLELVMAERNDEAFLYHVADLLIGAGVDSKIVVTALEDIRFGDGGERSGSLYKSK